jgi:hypothetical protein
MVFFVFIECRNKRDTLVRTKQWRREIRFGIWNVRSLYRSGSRTAVDRELARCTLDLLCLQEVKWDKGGTVRARDNIFSMEKETKIINFDQDFCTPQNSVSS